jgi:hypothetical protein
MLRISRGRLLPPAFDTPLARNWRPVAALSVIVVVAAFAGFVSLLGSWTATSRQSEPGAIDPPAIGEKSDGFGIPYSGTGPAAEIIRGTYQGERVAPAAAIVRDPTDRSGIPYSGTGRTAEIIRGGAARTPERTGVPYSGSGPAAEIIRGTYQGDDDVPQAPVARETTDRSAIPYSGTGRTAEIIRSGSDATGR